MFYRLFYRSKPVWGRVPAGVWGLVQTGLTRDGFFKTVNLQMCLNRVGSLPVLAIQRGHLGVRRLLYPQSAIYTYQLIGGVRMLVRSQCPAFQCCPSLTQLAAHHLVPDSVSTHQWAVCLQSVVGLTILQSCGADQNQRTHLIIQSNIYKYQSPKILKIDFLSVANS